MGKTEYLEQAKELEKPPFSTVRSPTNTKLPAITCTQRTMWRPIQTLCLPLQSQRALVTLASFGGPCSSGVPHPPYLLQFSPSSARIPSLQGEGSDGELQFRLSLHTISPWVSALPPVQCLSDKDKIRHGSRSRAEYHLKIISLIFSYQLCLTVMTAGPYCREQHPHNSLNLKDLPGGGTELLLQYSKLFGLKSNLQTLKRETLTQT